jgi:hypothetical protein
MRARAFFAVLVKAREMHFKKQSLFMLDLCDVVMSSVHFDNYKSMREKFHSRAFPYQPVRKSKALSYDNDSDMAKVESVFNMYGHLMG